MGGTAFLWIRARRGPTRHVRIHSQLNTFLHVPEQGATKL